MHQPDPSENACASSNDNSGGARPKHVQNNRNLKPKKFTVISTGRNVTFKPDNPEDDYLVGFIHF